ncbi:MAG: hypothetical protein RMY64_17660 [Nostoc sp. DedQUE08]|uniref:hypothetical protein n=1 Tax=unclassified Nostoc TaxID=2593658 RepID=UPI002AD282CF|nr:MULTISPECIES: hypothetical protein [unclassified Nostoc]MDZ8035576.1 hypothetical protein [Nostoc sp. DedSLP04]MDZ8067425.1 hypothetical protein [Nostoc sp. DedQUE08]MDZ8094941.1 hypothetical protein [Nostoc sp. DedQUE05]MDZ8131242.1 hypothetical protein [Nostoc sp. DedQUE07]MDZ8134358.1 hypothetical protein [Nostoc sp. DedQUE04]
MLQEASTRLIVPEPSEDLITNEPWSIENYADGLMDELFADIDYILDASGNLPSQTVRHSSQNRSSHSVAGVSAQAQRQSPPEYVPLQTVMIPQITLNQGVQSVAQDRHKQLSTVVFDTSTVKPVSRKRQKTSSVLGKLLIVGTTLGVAIASTIYLVQSGVVYLLNNKLPESALLLPQSQSRLPVKTEIEAELVDYMLQSLAVIDKQGAKSNQKSFNPGFSSQANTNQIAFGRQQATGNLPALPLLANNTPPAPNRSGSVVERIYVPVYQAPSPMRYALPAIPGTPTLLPQVASALRVSQPNVVKTALNTVRQAAKPVTVNMLAAAVRAELKPVAAKTAPITVRQTPKPLPALPVVPLRAALAPESEPTITQEQVYPATAIAVAPSNTLEGLLELGNKSAALFKIDGVTRRINMGESIGSSGWTLVDVSNGEAVVRRNGEVRSIYAGQKL